MHTIQVPGATVAPPIILQANRVRRRIAASDAVALLLSELAFGPSHRSDLTALASITADRVADVMGAPV